MKFINNKTVTHLYCDKGFTLAEVLIALVVIGVIAAITMTTVMPNIHERANSQRQANIVYKVTQATNLMKANGALGQFESTDAFVDELQKYLKIMKRCDSDHIAECWPTKKVRTSEGEEYEVKEAKKRGDLGFKDGYRNNPNVGIILTDGACIIMSYDPSFQGLSIGDKVITSSKVLPVGTHLEEYIEYTTNTTSGISFIMDVNGSKGPNSETIGKKMYDVRNLNAAHFSHGCGGFIVNNKCVQKLDSRSYVDIDCSRKSDGTLNHTEFSAYCPANSTYRKDAWAGAKKSCADLGLRLPEESDVKNNYKDLASLGITGLVWGAGAPNYTDKQGCFASIWSSSASYYCNGVYWDGKSVQEHNITVLCIE